MYNEKEKKWWRLRENPNRNLSVMATDIYAHTLVQKWLTWAIMALVIATTLTALHLFTFKHKENIVFSDGTLNGCLIKDTDL